MASRCRSCHSTEMYLMRRCEPCYRRIYDHRLAEMYVKGMDSRLEQGVTTGEVLRYVRANPGTTRRAIEEAMDMTTNEASARLQDLRMAQLITAVRKCRTAFWFEQGVAHA